jgi:hypothetical protein
VESISRFGILYAISITQYQDRHAIARNLIAKDVDNHSVVKVPD